MAPKKKMKSIQRERKAKPSPLEQNTNVGDGAQQVVKVVIQQPEQPKPKKRATKPKVDKKKAEAIEDLRSALQDYDQEQNKADELGITIPKELGVSPLTAGQIKNTDDILAFIQLIREKTQKIKELEARKEEAPKPKPNMFLTAPSRFGEFPPFFSPSPSAFIQPAGSSLPLSRIPVPPVPQTEIDRELADIEQSLNQASTPQELAFEDSLTKIQAGVFTIRDDIQKTYTSQNNQLAPEQISNYKQRYENRRKDLEKAFVKLPSESRNKLVETKSSLETVINDLEERLGKIERASSAPLPLPAPVPQEPEIDAEYEAAIQLLKNYIQQKTTINWSKKIIRALRIIGATDVDVADIARMKPGFPRREAVAQFLSEVTGGRVPKPSPDPSPSPQPSPNKTAARLRLITFVNDEDMEWSMSLLSDLKTVDAPLAIQNAVSETSSDDDRRTILLQFLGLSPRPPRFVPPVPRPPVDPAPSIPGILNQSPQNIQQAFSLLQAYRDTPSATFNDFVIQALDIFAPGTAEGVRFSRNEETRKAMVDGILAGGGAGSSLAPGDDPTRPPAFAPGGLGPGRGRRNIKF